MDFGLSDRCVDYQERLLAFMADCVYPAEALCERQMQAARDPHHHPPVMEDLKQEAKRRGLWNLFHPQEAWGAGLTNSEYAPLAEIMGRSSIASEACNCSPPDTGNMEALARFGSRDQQDQWLRPLIDGRIRSAFGMTETSAAGSGTSHSQLRIDREGDEYVLNGRRCWTTNALHPNCRILFVMGMTDPSGPLTRQQSMVLLPLDSPGVEIVRSLAVFGHLDREGHAELSFTDARVPVANRLAGEGDGHAIGQALVGPGRVHRCMRTIGVAERALEVLSRRAGERVASGERTIDRRDVRDWIAEARIEIDMVRLLAMKAAWSMDVGGSQPARGDVLAIEVAAPMMARRIIDRAIQLCGPAGTSDGFPLASLWAHQRTLQLADGPGEMYKDIIARNEVLRWRHDLDTAATRG